MAVSITGSVAHDVYTTDVHSHDLDDCGVIRGLRRSCSKLTRLARGDKEKSLSSANNNAERSLAEDRPEWSSAFGFPRPLVCHQKRTSVVGQESTCSLASSSHRQTSLGILKSGRDIAIDSRDFRLVAKRVRTVTRRSLSC